MDTETPLKGQSKQIDRRGKPEALLKPPETEDVEKAHREMIRQLFIDDGSNPSTEKYRHMLKEKDEDDRNLIHRMINQLKTRMSSQLRKQNPTHSSSKDLNFVPPKVFSLLEELVLEYPELLTQQDVNDIIPLRRAAEFNIEIFFHVVDLMVPEELLESIQKDCDQKDCDQNSRRCPLQDVNRSRLRQCATKKRSKGNFHQHEHSGMPDGSKFDESSCLHGSVDVKQIIERDKKLRDVLKESLKSSSCLPSLIKASNFDRANGEPEKRMSLKSFNRFLHFCDDKVFTEQTTKGYYPLQMAIRLYENESIDFEHLFSIVQALVSRLPSSIYLKTERSAEYDSEKTAYRLLEDLRERKFGSGAVPESLNNAKELLKKTCIGSEISWEKKEEFLYRDAKSVRQFCLNLSDESTILNRKHISTIATSSAMCFETVLDYVNLPYWNPENAKVRCHDGSSQPTVQGANDKREVSDPYIEVFRWLWKEGVRKVFTVEVDDDGPDPHSNAAIQESLRGQDETKVVRDFGVETWKWKKFDICSDTISRGAPDVKELHLYCSGNTAILRSWASKSGLARLTKLQKLRIEIQARNPRDKVDCATYQPELQRRLAKRCPLLQLQNIEVIYHDKDALIDDNEGNNSGDGGKDDRALLNDAPNPETWIKELESFKGLLSNLNSKKVQSVKIAVLDDGVKLTNLILKGTLKGETFRPDKVQYFVGPCSHGTDMVRCIWEIFPMAEIYVARLDDSRKVENQTFTTASAYKALEWARDMGVDIISMSWTFQKRSDNGDQDENRFFELVQSLQQNTILFGSLPDKGPTAQIMDYAPVGLPGVIRIGSATAYGEIAKQNIFASPDFILPGEDQPTMSGGTVSGSSFSTAYAAGLAGMVLFFLKSYKDLVESDEAEKNKRLDKAKTVEGMKTIFMNLCGKIPDDRKGAFFVRPYSILKLQSGSNPSEDGIINTMRSIAGLLQPRNVL